jgi:predicted nucleic acid-binding protein
MILKRLILDANILIRTVLGQKSRALLMELYGQVEFFSPSVCFDDAQKYLPLILDKRGVPSNLALEVLNIIAGNVLLIEMDWLSGFENQARRLLKCRDEQDWPILAAALALDCPIWTEDTDFFGVGVATWTTANLGYHVRNVNSH